MERPIVVVAPTFNEQDNIAAFLSATTKFVPTIVVSDSQSTDHTAAIVKTYAAKNSGIHFLVGKTAGPGKLGVGLTAGIDYAFAKLGAKTVITMEADLSNNPAELPKFVQKAQRADLVLGSRYVAGGKIVNWSWWRRFLSWAANLILMFLAGTLRVHEFTNLYRAFNKKTWDTVRPKAGLHHGWLFVPAFAFEAIAAHLTIVEQAIVYQDRFKGRSKMQTLSYTKNLLRYALRYRLNNYGSHS
ncbi:glycosyltransferase [Candidatus Microgenomates bacterium]|nr:glycosyltransferase [Candidatus Microgenomates bacterium]